MTCDDPNLSAAAPVRARDNSAPPVPPEDSARAAAEKPPDNSPESVLQSDPIVVMSDSAPLPVKLRLPGVLQFDASVPEDLRVPWDWKDLLLFLGFGLISLLVAAAIVGAVAVKVFGVSMSEITGTSTTTDKSLVLIVSQGLWSVFVLLFFFVLVRARSRAPFWRSIGWRGLHLRGRTPFASALQLLGGGAMLAICASFAGRFLGEQQELPIEQMFHSRATVILLMVFGIAVAPLVEETMFRGFLYPVVARSFGMGVGVIVTGIVFGAMHTQQLWGGWGQIGLLILVGILLTWVRARTRTVLASYLVHLGYNSLLFLGFFAATSGLQNLPGTR